MAWNPKFKPGDVLTVIPEKQVGFVAIHWQMVQILELGFADDFFKIYNKYNFNPPNSSVKYYGVLSNTGDVKISTCESIDKSYTKATEAEKVLYWNNSLK